MTIKTKFNDSNLLWIFIFEIDPVVNAYISLIAKRRIMTVEWLAYWNKMKWLPGEIEHKTSIKNILSNLGLDSYRIPWW